MLNGVDIYLIGNTNNRQISFISRLPDVDSNRQDGTNTVNHKGDQIPTRFVCMHDANHFLKERYPRLYYMTAHVLIPLLLLIGVAFFFGYLMAYFESTGIGGIDRIDRIGASPLGEKDANDKALADMYSSYLELVQGNMKSRQQISSTSVDCSSVALNSTAISSYDDETGESSYTILNGTEYLIAVEQCAVDKANSLVATEDYITYAVGQGLFSVPYFGNSDSPLTFDWTNCNTSNNISNNTSINARSRWFNHATHTFRAWQESYSVLFQQYKQAGYNDADATNMALQAASGHDECGVHTSGGAVYWFSIMTTVSANRWIMTGMLYV